MNFREYKVDFPDISFILSAAILLLLAVIAFQFSETRLLLDKGLSKVTGTAVELIDPRLEDELNQKYEQSKVSPAQSSSKVQSTIVTLVLWGSFGLVSYYLGFVFYLIFIKPFSSLAVEEHYVHHLEKKELIRKRILWCISVALTVLMCIGLVAVFRGVLLTYYVIFAHETRMVALTLFLVGLFICSMLTAFIRLGLRAVVRAY